MYKLRFRFEKYLLFISEPISRPHLKMEQKEAAEPRVRPSSGTRPSTSTRPSSTTGGRPCFSPSIGITCEIEFQKIKLDIF